MQVDACAVCVAADMTDVLSATMDAAGCICLSSVLNAYPERASQFETWLLPTHDEFEAEFFPMLLNLNPMAPFHRLKVDRRNV